MTAPEVRSNRSTRRVRPAGFISRLLAFLIDLVILSLTTTLVVLGVQEILAFFGLSELFNRWLGNLTGDILPLVFRIIAITFTYLFTIMYMTFFWLLIGYTPGKYLLGLKVIRTDGRKLTFGRCFTRALFYYISALCLFLGFFWIILDRKRQAWHDKVAGTLVIYI